MKRFIFTRMKLKEMSHEGRNQMMMEKKIEGRVFSLKGNESLG